MTRTLLTRPEGVRSISVTPGGGQRNASRGCGTVKDVHTHCPVCPGVSVSFELP
jgi:hypothetical protein